MASVASTALSIVLIGVLMTAMAMAIAGLMRVLRGGSATTDGMMRSGVSFGTLWRGDVPKQDSGSPIAVREGMRAFVEEDGSLTVVETRTIATDAL